MKRAALVFPHQLYMRPEALQGVQKVVLVEDHLYFLQYPFHQQKLVLYRASMQWYKAELEKKGHEVQYIAAHAHKDLDAVVQALCAAGYEMLHYTDPEDDWLSGRIRDAADACGISLKAFPNPNFLTTPEELPELLGKGNNWRMHRFYPLQRKRMDLLMENGEPLGGKWSFDTENRKKLPRGLVIPQPARLQAGARVQEAIAYVEEHFPDNPGEARAFAWASSRPEAIVALSDFLDQRMALFGPYEDAMSHKQDFVFHSLLTPALNIGLLSPNDVLYALMLAHDRTPFPLASLEGFVRQIIGWREFMRGVYRFRGRQQRSSNFFDFSRPIPPSFWNGTTGILPVDTVIRRVLRTGYSHHIERLMVMGNFMLLCEFDPNEVYEWFMALYIDAYDWVMVPNVYGMSQFADGGMFTTKPYLSGSNYIRKMSDYPKGDWCATWDALYWRFIAVHGARFRTNPRMTMVLRLWEKMDADKRNAHLNRAEAFLERLNPTSTPHT